jgi:hypothetical protein
MSKGYPLPPTPLSHWPSYIQLRKLQTHYFCIMLLVLKIIKDGMMLANFTYKGYRNTKLLLKGKERQEKEQSI